MCSVYHTCGNKCNQNFSQLTWREENTWTLGHRWEEDNIQMHLKEVSSKYGTKKPAGCLNGKGNFLMKWVAISISRRTLWQRIKFVVVCFTFEHGNKHLKQHSDSGKKHPMFTWAFIVQDGNSKAVFRRLQISATCCLIPDSVPGVASCQTSSHTLTPLTSEME